MGRSGLTDVKRFSLRTAIASMIALAIPAALVLPRWLRPPEPGPLGGIIARWRGASTDGWSLHWDRDMAVRRVALQTETPAQYAAFSPDGCWLAGAVNGELVVWDSETGRRVSSPTDVREVVIHLPASAFGPVIERVGRFMRWTSHSHIPSLVVTRQGVAILTHPLGYTTIDLAARRMTRGRFVAERVTEQRDGGVMTRLTPDGRLVVVAGDDVVLFSVDDPSSHSRLPLHGGELHQVESDPHGRWLVLLTRSDSLPYLLDSMYFSEQLTLYEGITRRGALTFNAISGLSVAIAEDKLIARVSVSGGWEERVYSLPGLELQERQAHLWDRRARPFATIRDVSFRP